MIAIAAAGDYGHSHSFQLYISCGINATVMNKLFLTFAIALLGFGCTSSKITSSWKARDAASQNYRKILVLGLIKDNDRTLRENIENHLVADLNARGYEAVSAMSAYGPKGFENNDEQAALSKLKTNGVDAVLTIVLLGKENTQRYVPGRVVYAPTFYYSRFWNYYGTLYHRIYEASYLLTDTRYLWESNLYDMTDQHLVYSVQTQSFDPASSATLGHEYGQLIVKNMVKNNVLSKTGPKKGF
jgi:hypothetical protein